DRVEEFLVGVACGAQRAGILRNRFACARHDAHEFGPEPWFCVEGLALVVEAGDLRLEAACDVDLVGLQSRDLAGACLDEEGALFFQQTREPFRKGDQIAHRVVRRHCFCTSWSLRISRLTSFAMPRPPALAMALPYSCVRSER